MKSAPENNLFSPNKTLNLRGRLLDLSIPKVMGILNVTPDSFYDGGRFTTEASVLQQTEKMLNEGATFIDVGAASTRPGATEISPEEERSRAVQAIKAIHKNFPDAFISIDTYRADVADAAVQEGAALVNDVSGGSLDPAMFARVAALNVPYVLMHMRGNPQTMTQLATYENLRKDLLDYFHEKIYQLQLLGIKDVVVDPGFGFAKGPTQNFELLHHLEDFHILNKPLLVGLSRKSMIWKTLNIAPADALNGTTVLNTLALAKGAAILRVHDVKEAVQAVTLISTGKGTHNG
ncbi:dihydropteroate synthase [Chryseolinea lacunae]|uniref:Dihydropteroate synthase n=1 Tax=Chryseolinea lacunae TaxID=2801331 RepID=A0ABS1KT17_9BACT|nr:dihydropteroate synthase [Chryseolinea lacunae]MBL0742333.1 dihydropteroate synthase [Chryseolinea lacunae]